MYYVSLLLLIVKCSSSSHLRSNEVQNCTWSEEYGDPLLVRVKLSKHAKFDAGHWFHVVSCELFLSTTLILTFSLGRKSVAIPFDPEKRRPINKLLFRSV